MHCPDRTGRDRAKSKKAPRIAKPCRSTILPNGDVEWTERLRLRLRTPLYNSSWQRKRQHLTYYPRGDRKKNHSAATAARKIRATTGAENALPTAAPNLVSGGTIVTASGGYPCNRIISLNVRRLVDAVVAPISAPRRCERGTVTNANARARCAAVYDAIIALGAHAIRPRLVKKM